MPSWKLILGAAIVIILLAGAVMITVFPAQTANQTATVTPVVTGGNTPAPIPTSTPATPQQTVPPTTRATIATTPTPTMAHIFNWASQGPVAPVQSNQPVVSVSDVSMGCLKCLALNNSYDLRPGNGELAILYKGVLYPNLTQDMLNQCPVCRGP